MANPTDSMFYKLLRVMEEFDNETALEALELAASFVRNDMQMEYESTRRV